MPAKPIKESVAFYALNSAGAFLAVKRTDDDTSIPGVWALPAASLRPGESNEEAVRRAARDKLGVEVGSLKYVGDDMKDKGAYMLHLSEYEVTIATGHPAPQQKDQTVSNYSAVQWSDDPELLREAAEKGSACSTIFLRNRGLWPNGN